MESNKDVLNDALNPADALGRRNVTTQKHTGKFYPCKMCGQEKCEASRSGRIPKYCPPCLKKYRTEHAATLALRKSEKTVFESTIVITMPDGSIAYLRNEEEKAYVQHRLDSYIKDFDWTESSDMGLLTKLVLLELQTNRIAKLLTMQYKSGDAKTMSVLTEEYRKCQADLGISRTKRVNEKTDTDAPTIMKQLMEKFRSYKEKHPDRFMWKCSHCGQISGLNRQNPDVPVEPETALVPEDAAPDQPAAVEVTSGGENAI